MTERTWNSLALLTRMRILQDLPDAVDIPVQSAWVMLPYWLRRYLAHYVTADGMRML